VPGLLVGQLLVGGGVGSGGQQVCGAGGEDVSDRQKRVRQGKVAEEVADNLWNVCMYACYICMCVCE